MKQIILQILLALVLTGNVFACEELIVINELSYFDEKHPFEVSGEDTNFVLVAINGNTPGQCGAIQMTAFYDRSNTSLKLKPVFEIPGEKTEYLIPGDHFMNRSSFIFVRLTCVECTVTKSYQLDLGSISAILEKTMANK